LSEFTILVRFNKAYLGCKVDPVFYLIMFMDRRKQAVLKIEKMRLDYVNRWRNIEAKSPQNPLRKSMKQRT